MGFFIKVIMTCSTVFISSNKWLSAVELIMAGLLVYLYCTCLRVVCRCLGFRLRVSGEFILLRVQVFILLRVQVFIMLRVQVFILLRVQVFILLRVQVFILLRAQVLGLRASWTTSGVHPA